MSHCLSIGSVTEQHHRVFLQNLDDGCQPSFLTAIKRRGQHRQLEAAAGVTQHIILQ